MTDLVLRIPMSDHGRPSYDTLTLERRNELFESIRDVDRQYGSNGRDAFGYQLRYLTVAKLLVLSAEDGVRDNWRNRAVWAYLGQLPRTWPIVLFWS